MIECFFDGAVIPYNPGGHGGFGILIRNDQETIHTDAVYIGRWESLSNNVAEYAGCIAVMRFLLREGISEARIYGDADLVIKQLNGEWKAKRGAYIPYYREAYALRARLPLVEMKWIPREMNYYADDLSKLGAGKRVIGFSLDNSVSTVTTVLKKRKGKRKNVRREFKEWSPRDDDAWELFKVRYGHL
jgi:ribonuclease HI